MTDTETRATDERTHRYRWWILATAAIGQLMVVLDATIVNIALPSAQVDLDFTDGNRQWVITAYSLAFGSLLPLGGRLGDLIGRKMSLLVSLIGFAGMSALAGAAGSFEVLIVARVGQGVFGALLAPTVLSILNQVFHDPKERATAFSVYGSVAGAGGAIGLLLGGVLTEYLDWRWTMYINVVFAVIALAGTFLFLSSLGRSKDVKIDIPGTLLISAGLFSLVFGFSRAEEHGWDSGQTIGFLSAGLVLIAAFVWWQSRTSHPLLPLRILTDRNRGAALITVLVSGAGMFGVFLFLTYYLQNTLDYSPVKTGLSFLPMVVGLAGAATLANNLFLPKVGPKATVSVGLFLAGASMWWMTTLELGSTYLGSILYMLILAGIGLGLSMAPGMNLATAGLREEDTGVGSATVNTMQQVGGSIGTALFTTLATTAATNYLADHMPPTAEVQALAALESYHTAFGWAAVVFVVGGIVTALLFRRGIPESSDTHTVHM